MSERRADHGPVPWRYDAAELADLYAVGALSDSERAELDARLLARDPELLGHLRRVASVSALLGDAIDATEAPPTARADLLARLSAIKREQIDEQARVGEAFADERAKVAAGPRVEAGAIRQESAGVVFRAAAEGRWWPTGLPGVWGKSLYKSKRDDRETLLVRCDPGALIPRHAHEGVEELLVVQGTLRVGEVLLGPGDYIRTQPGADHGDAVSPDGCICLFFTSHGVMSPRSRFIMFVRGVAHWLTSFFGLRR